MTAAVWSAVAAIFAAASSFLIFLIQRANLQESVRPELVLTDWERRFVGEGAARNEVLYCRTIQNIGRGTAMHVIINLPIGIEDPPTALLGRIRLPILDTNEKKQIDAEISLLWENVAPGEVSKPIPIDLEILCWDSRGRRYETRYGLFVIELRENAGVSDAIAPGVGFGSRRVISKSRWSLNLSDAVQKHWERVRKLFVRKVLPQIAKAQKLALEWWANHKKK